MKIQLSSAAQDKLEQILNYLYTRYDLEEIMPYELVEALISLGRDLIVSDERTMSAAEDKLLEYVGRTAGMKLDLEDTYREGREYRG